MYAPRPPRSHLSSRATISSALRVVAVCGALFASMRVTRPHDLTGALLLLGVFLVLGSLVVLVRRAGPRDPLLRQGPGCVLQNPAGNLVCALPDGHHGPHLDRRTRQPFQDTLTGSVDGATFYRDESGRREVIHDAF
ncbi:hypothetical protein [uncultured Kocuria sp.]|uniref:hypothetical protein n=1 Tax=uncultured Kocuria sp. TaxID=259305 RepID=UPI002606C533|nr:hypothetical protein [uncultured Kocuria sp.]